MKKIILFFAFSLLLINLGNQSFAESEKLVMLDTNMGKIIIEFFPDDAPNHVDNFIGLTESGFYDGTLFHRIIPGFMIQGGDPNTKSGDQNSWGQGGPDDKINSEFNSIKHNRGIVSMARAQDPNSAGSQFFIVHKDSNFLDGQYTVFGRIVTEESFTTLDKIAAVQIGTSDRPANPEKVKITNAVTVKRSDVSNLLELSKPERTESTLSQPPDNQKFKSVEHGIEFSAPEGWLLQQPQTPDENTPTIVAVGPKTGTINPQIYLFIKENDQTTFDELISEKIKTINEQSSITLISQKKYTINGNQAFETFTENYYEIQGKAVNVAFKEILIYTPEKIYTLGYGNESVNFESQFSLFEETINSFRILTQETPTEPPQDNGGGCLIATATYGSEMATQVQQLREIRDNQLLNTKSGKSFVNSFNDVYYSFSPIVADYERENPVFREAVKLAITPMISTLSIMSYAESDSEVVSLGVGVILLNLGMYLGVPVAVVVGFKKRK